MADEIAEYVARVITVRMERMRASNALVQEQLSRSYKQITISEELLRLPVPKVWHPEAPQE